MHPGRIGKLLQSEELKRDLTIDSTSTYAVDVAGDFQFPSHEPPDLTTKQGEFEMGGGINDKIKAREAAQKLKKERKEAEKREKKGLPPLENEKKHVHTEPFAVRDVDLQIPRGELMIGFKTYL